MKIGILFGGRSYEHDISIITAAQVAAALEGRAEIYPIYADNGEFYLIRGGIKIRDFANRRVKKRKLSFC
ncbi:MAG: D-alanine--D-alanine ligase, partial [Clostridia bacterium]|nr:D-alanine--D-alanine ligase [Clostridia bacterium]